MGEMTKRVVFGLACIAGAAWLMVSPDAEALPAGTFQYTVPGGVTCPPLHLGFVPVRCGNGYQAVLAETESATAVYFCGNNAADGGITSANVATSCAKRCDGCKNGTQYTVDVISSPPQVYCMSASTTDGGVTVAVSCVR
jgi:hypothetical protein